MPQNRARIALGIKYRIYLTSVVSLVALRLRYLHLEGWNSNRMIDIHILQKFDRPTQQSPALKAEAYKDTL